MTSGTGRPAVLVVLTNTYAALASALAAALEDTECAPDAPWAQWRVLDPGEPDPAMPWDFAVRDERIEGPPIPPWRLLVQAAELAGATTANTLRGHLAWLGRAYWPDIHDPADNVIAFPAIYPPAWSGRPRSGTRWRC